MVNIWDGKFDGYSVGKYCDCICDQYFDGFKIVLKIENIDEYLYEGDLRFEKNFNGWYLAVMALATHGLH